MPTPGAREVGPDLDLLRGLDAADAALDERADLPGGHVVAGVELEDGGDPLAPLVVGQADDRAVEDRGVGQQGLLDLGRVDVEPAGDDHVLEPVDDVQVAVVVQVADVAGVMPAVPGGLGGRGRDSCSTRG